MISALVAIGSNLGDRSAHIERSLAALSAMPQIDLAKVSTIVETDPVGPAGQGPYLNAAAELHTPIESARDLLDLLLGIEHWLGRNRANEQRWGPRTIDLDLLVFGEVQIESEGLTVPHPRLHEREFVLVPLAEIAPDREIPGLNATPFQLLAKLHQRTAHA